MTTIFMVYPLLPGDGRPRPHETFAEYLCARRAPLVFHRRALDFLEMPFRRAIDAIVGATAPARHQPLDNDVGEIVVRRSRA